MSIKDFWLIDSALECCDRPWAMPGLLSEATCNLTKEQRQAFVWARPFDFSLDIWLDRGSRGKLSDMLVPNTLTFVMSPKLHDLLEPFFGTTVRSREVEIRSKHKGNVMYRVLAIEEGAGPIDQTKGAIVLYAKSLNPKGVKFVDCYGIHFDTSTWTGADIFRLGPNGNQMIVTPRVAEAVLAADTTGVEITRLDQYGIEIWDRYLQTGKGPGEM